MVCTQANETCKPQTCYTGVRCGAYVQVSGKRSTGHEHVSKQADLADSHPATVSEGLEFQHLGFDSGLLENRLEQLERAA